jgi:hypothetical protein
MGRGSKMAPPSNGGRTDKQVREAIDALDLERVENKAMELYRWRRARAKSAATWYRNFLYLCHKEGAPLAAIGKDSDDFWHLHILDTRKYAADCRAVFGKFLNHQPLYGEPTANQREVFERSKTLYRHEYGKLPPRLSEVSFWN